MDYLVLLIILEKPAQMQKYKVSIVIPVYNSESTLNECLSACLSQDYNSEYEVIAVDDGSIDLSAYIIKHYPVKYIYQKNNGPATARNTGWENAGGEIICFTDSDCVPQSDWLSKITSDFSNDGIAGVGGTYAIANPSNLLANLVQEEITQRHISMPVEVNFLGSFNVAYRRHVLEEVHGFDVNFRIASGEDNDLAYKIISKGYKLIFDINVVVAHYHPEKFFNYLKTQLKHGYWRVYLYVNHPKMMRGDSYSGLKDYLQPPLAMVILFSIPLIFFNSILGSVWLGLLLIMILLQLPFTYSIYRRTNKFHHLLLSIVTFFRGFARGLGMLSGFWDFFILGNFLPQNIKSKNK